MPSLQVTGKATRPTVYFAFSGPDFKPYGQSVANVPLFYHGETMALLEAPTEWMFHLALERGRIRSERTWKAYAECLLDWLRHCHANGWDPLEVAEGHLGAYRRHMLRTKSIFGKPYAPATINARINAVARFYEWMFSRGKISAYPFGVEESYNFSEDRGTFGFARRSAKRRVGSVPISKQNPKALPLDLVKRIRASLGERNRLIVDWAVTTGMRQDEILSLTLTQLPEAPTLSANAKARIWITKTKGLYPRFVHVPVKLIDRTWTYVNSERARITRRMKTARRFVEPPEIFLSERGRPLSAKTLYAAYAKAVRAYGARHTFHQLRDTYAIHRLVELQRIKDLGLSGSENLVPIMALKQDLGHRHLAATQIYLKSLEQDTSSVEHELKTFLDDVL